MEEADKLIVHGKKLMEEDVLKAVDVFQEASRMLAKKFGEEAEECALAYYWYAVSLLEQERMENRVLGNALVGICVDVEKSEDSILEGAEKFDEEDIDDLRAQVYDAMAVRDDENGVRNNEDDAAAELDEGIGDNAAEENDEDSTAEDKTPEKAEGHQNGAAENGEPKTVEEEDKDGDKKKAEVPEDESKETEGDKREEMEVQEEGGDGAESRAEDIAEKESDDEVDNLQLAWEMLELAKLIYKRKDSKKDKMMLAQVHMKLGEVSAESGNYKEVKEDFSECLNLQLTYLEPDSRQLAETYYNMGVVYTNVNLHDDAAESLKRSIAIINARLENLQKAIDKATGPEDMADERQEMTNLQSLLPEIKTKEEEAIESAKLAKIADELPDEGTSSTAKTKQNRDLKSKENGSSAKEKSSTQKTPPKDCSYLLRKKRKPESPRLFSGKKPKQEQMDDDEQLRTSVIQARGSGEQNSGAQGQSGEGQGSEGQSSGAQGQSSGGQGSNETQGQSNGEPENGTQGSGAQGQASGGQDTGAQGQDTGAQGQSSEGQDNGTQGQSGEAQGQVSGAQGHDGPVVVVEAGACNQEPDSEAHAQSNGPSNTPHLQGIAPPNTPQLLTITIPIAPHLEAVVPPNVNHPDHVDHSPQINGTPEPVNGTGASSSGADEGDDD